MSENADPDKYKYSSYDIGFDVGDTYSLSSGRGFGKNLIIFGFDISSSAHIYNRKKDILILDKSPTQWLDDTTLTAEKEHAINFREQQKKLCIIKVLIVINLLMLLKYTNSKKKTNAA